MSVNQDVFDGVTQEETGPPTHRKTKKPVPNKKKDRTIGEGIKTIITPLPKPDSQIKVNGSESTQVIVDVLRPEKPSKQETTDNDPERRASLILNLEMYTSNEILGKHLRRAGFEKTEGELKKMTVTELEYELKRVEILLNNKNNSNVANGVLKGGIQMLENIVSSKTKLQIKGLADSCFSNENWLFLLEKVKMKYGLYNFGVNLDPAVELALITAQTAAMLHAHNSFRESIKTTLNLDEEILVRPTSERTNLVERGDEK